MTDPRTLLATYFAQRRQMGEAWWLLELEVPASSAPAARSPAPRVPEPAEQPPRPAPQTARSPGEAAPAARSPRGAKDWRRGAPPIPATGIVVPRPVEDLFNRDPLAGLSLEELAAAVRSCTKCPLCRDRTQAVPGEGPADASLVVVGEGPGATEDETGRPFVGRAGQLLTDILAAVELPRERVFICNVVKCRPPGNRRPQPEEIAACVPYLYRQLDLIRPKVILAMGNTAAETLLNTKQSLGALRGRVHQFRGIPVVVTYHPAALLRNPHWKKPTWDDVRIARALLDV